MQGPWVRVNRAAALARSGRAEAAESEAIDAMNAARGPNRAPMLYEASCALALAARHGSPSDRDRLASEALAFLEEARGLGFFRYADRVRLLTTNPDFEAIRDRPGFSAFLRDAIVSAWPFLPAAKPAH